MPSCGTHLRNFIAILLVAAIPWCCCSFRSVLGGAWSYRATWAAGDEVPLDHQDPPGTQAAHACCGDSSARAANRPDTESDQSDGPHECCCDSSGGKMLSAGAPDLEFPAPFVVAVLVWSRVPEIRGHDPSNPREPLDLAVHRPMTTLVRLHCALMV